MFAFFDVCLHLKKVPPPKIPIRQPVNYLRVRWLQLPSTCHRIKKFCWQSNPKSPGLLFWVFYFRRTEFSTKPIGHSRRWQRLNHCLWRLNGYMRNHINNFWIRKDRLREQTDLIFPQGLVTLRLMNLKPQPPPTKHRKDRVAINEHDNTRK